MKKIVITVIAVIAIAIIAASFYVSAAAEEDCTMVLLPQSASMTVTSTGISISNPETHIILSENHKFRGIKNMDETSQHAELSFFNKPYNYIYGFIDGKVIRDVGLQEVYECGEGFTVISATIEIESQYVEEVKRIVFERTQSEALSTDSILAAALWRINNYAGYIFYTSYTQHIIFGKLITEYGWAYLAIGDINKDGYNEVGLLPGQQPYTNTNTNVVINTNTNTNINITTECNNNTYSEINVNNGSNNNIVTTTTNVNGNNNNTTVVTNNTNTNMYALIGIVINNDNNNTIVNTNSGQQEICKPSLFVYRDSLPRNPNSGCG